MKAADPLELKRQTNDELLELVEELKISDRFFQKSDDGLFAFDLNCHYIYWGGIMEKISGLKSNEVLGKKDIDLFPFLKNTKQRSIHEEVLKGKSFTIKEEAFSVQRTGRSGFYEGFYSPLKSKSGEILGGLGIVRNITERKRSEEKLAETELRFKTMADVAPVLLWMSGTDSLCTFFNHSWLEFTGRSFEQEWGVGWTEGVHAEDFQQCVDTYIDAFNERRIFEMEYRLRRYDGEYRWILDRGAPRYTPSGDFAGFIGSCIDITDRKKMEADLLDAVRARDEFLSIASHELKTPLTSLNLHLQLFQHTLHSKKDHKFAIEKAHKIVDVSNRQLKRMNILIEDLLDVSRITSGKFVLNRTETDLIDLTSEVLDRLEHQLKMAGCIPQFSFNSSKVIGKWDRFRLDQVLTNLFTNVIRYAPGKPVEISVEQNDNAPYAVLSVRDYGIGIEKEKLPLVFERFQRAVSAQNYGGLGLGLYIVRQIVEAHGGNIQVESKLGEGSTFTVQLPLSGSRVKGS